jgi:transposase
MIKVEDWAEVRRLHFAEGTSIKAIMRETGLARNTVRCAIRSDRPPRYERAAAGSIVDVVEPQIRALLQSDPRMPATVIAERIGWERSMTVLKDRVRELRPMFLPADPVQRTSYRPGELAQWDLWFPAVDIPVEGPQVARPPVIVGVSGFSRFITARMIPSRETADVLAGHLVCLVQLGGVPRKGVYVGEPAISTRRNGRAVLTEAFQAFRGMLGMGAYVCKPGDPEAKGLVERANRYLETSLLPGRCFAEWVARLADAHNAGRLLTELTRLGRIPLLTVDEVGYIPFEAEAANLFFQLISSRYERASIIVTSNKPFGRWGEVFGDALVAGAAIDRLVHHAEVLSLKGDSYRLKDKDLGRRPTTDDGA